MRFVQPVDPGAERSGPVRVLVVDDDPEVASLVGTYLGRLDGVHVRTRTDPLAALAHLDAAVDCVVSDYEMPEMDGLAVLDAVREAYPDLPFVLFTAVGDEAVAERARTRGARYVEKGRSGGGFEGLVATVERELDD